MGPAVSLDSRDNTWAPEPAKLTLAGELWSAGLGFRYMLDAKERVNLRMDFGFGNGDSGFFLSLGEAF